MMVRSVVLATALLAATASAQTATLNVLLDDTGRVYLNGTEVVLSGRNSSVPVTILQGQNSLAVEVLDLGWGGGFMASIDLSQVGTPDTVISGADWKCTDDAPAGWTAADFDHSSWRAVGTYGTMSLARDSGYDTIPARSALAQHAAQWVWTPKTVYIRKSFFATAAGSDYFAGLLGSGFGYKLYVNGTQIGSQDSAQGVSQPVDSYNNQTLAAGNNAIAIEATCYDTLGLAYLKAGVWKGSTRVVVSDSTWKYSFDAPTGWTETAYDDASWRNIQEKDGGTQGGPFGPKAKFIWPCKMYFRTTFNAPVAGVRHISRGVPASSRTISRQSFNLLGERVTRNGSQVTGTAVVVERVTQANGVTQVRTRVAK